MDAISFLVTEHRRLRRAVHRLEIRAERAPSAAFVRLAGDLAVHAAIEEELLYPLLERMSALRDGARHAYQEHHVIDQQIDGLIPLDPASSAWHAQLHVLREVVEHHLDDEEEEVFPLVPRHLFPAELERMGDDMRHLRQQHEARLAEHPPESAQAESLRRVLSDQRI